MIIKGFDANNYADDHDPIPESDYNVILVKSEMKTTKSGTGQYIALDFQVVDGLYSGRHIFENLNVVNPNPKAVEIANKKLANLCRAVGNLTPDDTHDLHDKPLIIRVAIKDEKNIITRYIDAYSERRIPTSAEILEEKTPW